MASASHHAFVEAIDQLMLHPWRTAIFTFLFLLTLLRPIIQNFLYLKRPAHFLPLTLSGLLRKPDAAVPLVKLGKGRNYAEALAQGSDLVSVYAQPATSVRLKKGSSIQTAHTRSLIFPMRL